MKQQPQDATTATERHLAALVQRHVDVLTEWQRPRFVPRRLYARWQRPRVARRLKAMLQQPAVASTFGAHR